MRGLVRRLPLAVLGLLIFVGVGIVVVADPAHEDAVSNLTEQTFDAFTRGVPSDDYLLIEFFACVKSYAKALRVAFADACHEANQQASTVLCTKADSNATSSLPGNAGRGVRSASGSSPSLHVPPGL